MLESPLQPVPLLDFSREYSQLREEVLAAITAVCDSQRFILGPQVEQFEAAAAAHCDVDFAIGCASGTDALWLAMAALEIGPAAAGELPTAVITTPFSFFATASSILRCGATPLFADIDPATFNLSPATVAAVLEQHADTHDIKAILPVHLYGQCADMDAFRTLATQHGIAVVEDAAQAFCSTWNNVPAGALGDAAAFSFYPTKNLAAFGDAGLVTTPNAAVAERAQMLRGHGMRRRYFHDEVGWNSRLDTLQAAVLSVKLRYVDAGNLRRREIAALYAELFASAGLLGRGLILPYTDPRAGHVFHQYVIRVPQGNKGRDELRAHLSAHQIGTEVYYPLSLHQQESLKYLGYKTGDFPESERASAEVLALPIYPGLRSDEVETVVEGIRRFYAN